MRQSMRRLKRGVNAALAGTIGYRLVRSSADAAVLGGLVEEFTAKRVKGWVAVPAHSAPVRVALVVNKHEVTATWAADPGPRDGSGELRFFEFALRDVWSYCRKSDRLSVRVGHKALPIVGHGMYLVPSSDGNKRLAALRAKLASGHVFGHTGRLQLSKRLDTEWQTKVMGMYARVRDAVRDAYGYDVFLMYGTLLGAVREGSVIGHDVDIDAAYLSRHSQAKSAAAELRDIGLMLVDRGFDVDCQRSALHIHDAADRAARVDLFHLYFDDSDRIQFPFGVAGTTEIPRSDWRGTREVDFCGARALVPANAEQVVEHVYGANWRIPNPGFAWGSQRQKRDMTGVLPVPYVEEVHWSNFYRRMQFGTASAFFEWVEARSDTPRTVVDIGSGDGRDALAFGKTGRTVLGIDQSAVGVRHASRRAAELGLDGCVRFAICDVADADGFKQHVASLASDADGPLLFYLRFLLHVLTEETQETLMTAIAETARTGDMFAAEFRTDQDESLPKAFGKRYRRYQSASQFGALLHDRYGFDVLDEAEGRGLSPYEDEDPYLYRVIARR